MTALELVRRITAILWLGFAITVMTMLMAAIAHAKPPKLTDVQKAFVVAQVEAQFGALEKVAVRPLAQGGGITWVQVLTDPELTSGRGFYGLLDAEKGHAPCIVAAFVPEDHTLVEFGAWPAGECAADAGLRAR